MNLSSQIKDLALQMKFDVVGFTRPELLSEGEAAIKKWTDEGRHGNMKYLEDFASRKERMFAEFHDAKSVIVLGVNYYSSDRHCERPKEAKQSAFEQGQIASVATLPRNDDEGTVTGRVARYAWGLDYHQVIRKKHEELILKIAQIAPENFRAKSCIDTQPLPERYAAVRAGFGFLGKHTNLLNQKFGPWLFLSEILVNVELEEDLPSEGNCGTCVHCQKVCPTGALDEDYKMDARRCIAYLTIEHKGVIDRELRPFIKDWIFGCDECLEICPFTSKSQTTSWPEFLPGSGAGERLDIEDLFNVKSNSEYEKKFAGTALLRAGRKQMLRNACLVLANSGHPRALPLLEKALGDSSTLVRLHAAWGLGAIRNPASIEALRHRLPLEEDPEVLEEIKLALHPPSNKI